MTSFTDGVSTGSQAYGGYPNVALANITRYAVTPVAKNAANLFASARPVGTTATMGGVAAGVTKITMPDGTTRLQLDVPRAIQIVSAGADDTKTATFKGWDVYGAPMTQTVTMGTNIGTAAASTLKAFYQLNPTVTFSVRPAAAITIGTTDILGLPFRVANLNDIVDIGIGVLASDAGTAVVADLTSPATALTGDVRGTYVPSVATGTETVTIFQAVTITSQTTTFGVTQF
jgi:hypothetical protein